MQSVTVSAGQDDDAVNDTATLAHTASGGGYGAVTGSVSVTVADDETAELVPSPTSLPVVEGGEAELHGEAGLGADRAGDGDDRPACRVRTCLWTSRA